MARLNPVANKAAQLVAARTDPNAKLAEKEREATIKDAAVEPRRPLGARTNLDSGGQPTTRDTPIRIKATASGRPSTTSSPDYQNPSPAPFKFGDLIGSLTDRIPRAKSGSFKDVMETSKPIMTGVLGEAFKAIPEISTGGGLTGYLGTRASQATIQGVIAKLNPPPPIQVKATQKEYALVDGITGRTVQRQIGKPDIIGNRADTFWNAILTRAMSVNPDFTSAFLGGTSGLISGLVSGAYRTVSHISNTSSAFLNYDNLEDIVFPGIINIPGPIRFSAGIGQGIGQAFKAGLTPGSQFNSQTMDEYYEEHPEQLMMLRTDTWTHVRPEDAPLVDQEFKNMGIPHTVVSVTPLDAAKVAIVGNAAELAAAVYGGMHPETDYALYKQVTGVNYPIPKAPMDIVRENHKAEGRALPFTESGNPVGEFVNIYTLVHDPDTAHAIRAEVEAVRADITRQAKQQEQLAMEAGARGDIRAAEDYWMEYWRLMSQTYRHDGEQYLPSWDKGANLPEIGAALWSANIDLMDNPLYTYSMLNNPTLFEAELRNLAQISAQLGRALDPINNKDDKDIVLAIRSDNTNWGDEAFAAIVYDPLSDLAIGGTMKAGKFLTQGLGKGVFNLLPKAARASLTKTLLNRAASSAAKMLSTNMDEVGMAAYHYSPFTWGKFVDIVVDDVTYILNGKRMVDASRLSSAGGSTVDGLEAVSVLAGGLKGQEKAAIMMPGKLVGFKPLESMRRLHEVITDEILQRALQGGMEPGRAHALASLISAKAGNYRKFAEDSGRRVFERAFTTKYDKLIKAGIEEEEAARQAVEYALAYSNDFRNVIPAMKETIEKAYIEFRTPSKALGVTDDTLIWKMFGGVNKAHVVLGDSIRAYNKIRGIWATTVLSFRPAWIARNIVDTYFRVMIETGGGVNIFTNLAQSYSRMAPFLEELPPMPSSISRTLSSSSGIDQLSLPLYERILSNPKRYKFPFVYEFWRDAKEFQEGGARAAASRAADLGRPLGKGSKAANKVLGTLSAFSNTMRDMNSLVELSARVTTLEHHVTKVWKPLNAVAWGNIEAGFRAFGATEDTVQLAKQLWEGSGYSINRLVTYLDVIAREEQKVGRTVSHSLFMTPQIEQSLHGLSPMDQMFFKEIIIDRSNRYFVDILNSGRVPDEVDVKLFVQNIRDQVNVAYREQGILSTATRMTDGSKGPHFDTSEATKSPASATLAEGEPIVSGVDVEGTVPKLEFSEPAADAPIKKDPRIPKGQTEPAITKPDPISDPTKPNIAAGDDAVAAASDESYKLDPINSKVEQAMAEDAAEEGGIPKTSGMDRPYEQYRQADKNMQQSHAELSRRGAEKGKEPNSILLREEFYLSDMRVRQWMLRKYPGPLDAPVGARRGRWGRYFTLSNIVREQEAKAFDARAAEFLRTGKYEARKAAQVLEDMGGTFKLDEAGSPIEIIFKDAEGRQVFSIRSEAEIDDFMREFFGPGYAQYDTQTLLNTPYTRLNYHDEMYKTSNIGAAKETARAGGPSFYTSSQPYTPRYVDSTGQVYENGVVIGKHAGPEDGFSVPTRDIRIRKSIEEGIIEVTDANGNLIQNVALDVNRRLHEDLLAQGYSPQTKIRLAHEEHLLGDESVMSDILKQEEDILSRVNPVDPVESNQLIESGYGRGASVRYDPDKKIMMIEEPEGLDTGARLALESPNEIEARLTTIADEIAQHPNQHPITATTSDELVPRGTPYEVVDYNRSDGCHIRFITSDGAPNPVLLKNGATETEIVVPWKRFEELWNGSEYETIGGLNVTPINKLKRAEYSRTAGVVRDPPKSYSRFGIGPGRSTREIYTEIIEGRSQSLGRGARGTAVDQLRSTVQQLESVVRAEGESALGVASRETRDAALVTLASIERLPAPVRRVYETGNILVMFRNSAPPEYSAMYGGAFLVVPTAGGISNSNTLIHEALHWMLERGNVSQEMFGRLDSVLASTSTDVWRSVLKHSPETAAKMRAAAEFVVNGGTWDSGATGFNDLYSFIMFNHSANISWELKRGRLPIKMDPKLLGVDTPYYERIVNLTALYGAIRETSGGIDPLSFPLGGKLQAEMYSYLVEATPSLAKEIFDPFNFPEARLLDLANRYGFAPDIAAARATFDQLIAEGADPIMAREGATTALAERLVAATENLGIEKGMRDQIVKQLPADFRRVLSADEMVRDMGAHVLPQDFATLHAEKFAADVPIGDPRQSIKYIQESLESIGSLGGTNQVRSRIYANAVARQLGIITEEEQMVFSVTDVVEMVMGSSNPADEFLASEPGIYYQLRAAANAAWRGTISDPDVEATLSLFAQGITLPPGSITEDVIQAVRVAVIDGVSNSMGKSMHGPNAQLLAELGADPQRIQSALRVYKDLNPDVLVDDLNPFGTMIPRSIQDASQLNARLPDDYAKIKDDVERAKFVHEVELDLARSKQELWNAFMETKFGPMKLSIREILGDTLAPEGEVLTKALENLRVRIVEDSAQGIDVSPLQIVYNHIMQFEHYVDSYANSLGVTRPFAAADKVGAILPPNIIARDLFARYANDLTEFSKKEAFLKTLDEFEQAMIGQVNSGMVRAANLPADQIDIIKKMVEPMAREKEGLLDLVLHGSKDAPVAALGNKAWEGAVPKTARAMIDYENYNVLEASVKSVLPFSLFTIRSVPYWLETIAQHPEIARVYTKYLVLTDRVNRQRYMTNTQGQALKSFRGYIKIPGTDIYVNPFAALSFRYVLAAFQEVAVPDDEFYVDQKNVAQEIAGHFYEVGRALGMDLPPWITAPALAIGILDRKSVTPYALAPFLELVPWWGLTYEIEGFRKIYDKQLASWVNPAVSWQDVYIEQEALKIVMSAVENAPNDASAWDAINEYKLAMGYREIEEYPYYRVAPREDSKLWLEARKNVEKKDWFFTVAGYFTGTYGKSFTDADADLRVVRNNINIMKLSINNAVGRDLLKMDPDPIIARKQYMEAQYNTFEGNINLLYNLGRIVKIPETGGQAQGEERRKLMVDQLSKDTLRNDFLDGLSQIRDEREELLSVLPIGADWSLRQPIYDEAAMKDQALKSNPMYAPYVGYKGYSTRNKSPEEIEKFYVNQIMYYIQGTQPDWDQTEMDYPTYQREVYNPWLLSIPKVVQSYVNTAVIQTGRHGDPSGKWPSMVPISGTLVAGGKEEMLDLDGFLMEWATNFDPESYDVWRKSEDDIGEALNESWKINIWNPYWEGMSLQEHSSDKELYHREFMGNMPKQEEIVNWILADPIYGSRFTKEEIDAYLKGAGGMVNPEQRLEQSRNETEDKAQDIWDVLLAVGPGSGGRDALEVEIAKLGGDPNDLNTFYDTSGTWGSVSSRTGSANFNKFHDILLKAANNLGLEPPTEEVLREFSSAQNDNDMFRTSMEKTYGAQLWTDLAVYGNLGTAEKKQMRAEKPYIMQYWDDKDAFAANHQTWAKYFNPTKYSGAGGTGSGSGGGYGGGGGGRGYTTMQVPMKKMVPIPYESGLSASATPMGRRGDMKVLGSAGNVPWPAGFSKLIGPVAMQEITQMYTVRVPLSAKTTEFLTATAQRNPQYTGTVTTILNTNLGLTERQFEGKERIAGGIPR